MTRLQSSNGVLSHLSRGVRPESNLQMASLLTACLMLGLFATSPLRVHGEDVNSTSKSAKPTGDSEQAKSEAKVLGFPDYTKITGYIEGADLPTEQPEVLWSVVSELNRPNGKAEPNPISNVAYADGVLYFGDDEGSLRALDVNNQTLLWTHDHRRRIAMTPSVDRDFVYFGSEAGVTALRRETGEVVWLHGFDQGVGETTPLPVGEFLFGSAYSGHAFCLKRQSGQLVWLHNFAEDAPLDPKGFEGKRARFQNIVARPNGASCDGRVFVQSIFDQSRVIAIDCETGKRRWTFQAEGWISPAPTIADGRVYIASQDEHLYCVDLASGELIWKFKTQNWLASQPAVYQGHVFLPAHQAKLYQLAADTGKLIRVMEPPEEADRDGAVYSFPIIANKTAYFACGKGLFFAFDIESGNMRWKLRPSEHSEMFSNPVTDGHQIFVTTRNSLDRKNKGEEQQGECSIVSIGIDR